MTKLRLTELETVRFFNVYEIVKYQNIVLYF
jgi:hypothetical protein